MSVSIKKWPAGGALAVLGSLLMAGCGGGGDDVVAVSAPGVASPQVPVQPPVIDDRPTADVQQLGSVANRCGVGSFEEFGANGINSGSFLATFNGASQPVGYLVSSDYYDISVRMDIAIPQTDFRLPSLSGGHMTHKMGVAMNGPFLVGALACVKGVGRIAVVNGVTQVNWFSDALAQLPVDQLPGAPVAGMELFGNFDPSNVRAYFTFDAAAVTRPDAMSICKLTGADSWSCAPASNAFDDVSLTHTFTSPIEGHGVYVLTEVAATQP